MPEKKLGFHFGERTSPKGTKSSGNAAESSEEGNLARKKENSRGEGGQRMELAERIIVLCRVAL